jgi:hypothetical protein
VKLREQLDATPAIAAGFSAFVYAIVGRMMTSAARLHSSEPGRRMKIAMSYAVSNYILFAAMVRGWWQSAILSFIALRSGQRFDRGDPGRSPAGTSGCLLCLEAQGTVGAPPLASHAQLTP